MTEGETITGGCQCGQVRYALPRRPTMAYCCHCRECQRQSASAFGLSVPVALADLHVTGRLASWERATDLGSRTRCFFCPDCGSRVYHRGSGSLGQATIKGGTFDDPSWIAPAGHIWVSRKQPWVTLDPSVPQHPTQPDDLDAWRHGRAA